MPLADDVSQLGEECKMYVDSAGAEQGSWAAVDAVIDDSDSFTRREADSICRGDAEIKTHVGKPKFTNSGNILFKRNDTQYEVLRDAAYANTTIGIALMNGVITEVGAEGWWRDMKITQWNETRPDGDTVKVAFSMVTAADSAYVSVFKQITA